MTPRKSDAPRDAHAHSHATTHQKQQSTVVRAFFVTRPYAVHIVITCAIVWFSSWLKLQPAKAMKGIVDDALPSGNKEEVLALSLKMIVVPFFRELLEVVYTYLTALICNNLVNDLRTKLFNHFERLSLTYFTHTKTGEVMSRLSNDVNGAEGVISHVLIKSFKYASTLVITVLAMLSIHFQLSLIAFAVVPLFLIPAQRVDDMLRTATHASLATQADMTSFASESLNVSGVILTKLMGREEHNQHGYYRKSRQVLSANMRASRYGGLYGILLQLMNAVGTGVVFWQGVELVMTNEITAGDLVQFSSYIVLLYNSLASLLNAKLQFTKSLVSFERVFEVLDLEVDLVEVPMPHSEKFSGSVRFDRVSFHYPAPPSQQGGRDPEKELAIQNLSFSLMPGTVAAVVGRSGSGKSSLLKLVTRLYDCTSGGVYLDSVDIKNWSFAALARSIGTVSQDCFFFNDTVRSNLLYARLDATDEDIRRACEAANIWTTVQNLPLGLDTIVGARGFRLSGGELQRLSIARVILKQPQLLILDEATSALDSVSESLIQKSLQKLFVGRTCIVVAHRLSTILQSDVILAMDNGHLIEQGSHTELLSNNGLYASLYRTQFGSS